MGVQDDTLWCLLSCSKLPRQRKRLSELIAGYVVCSGAGVLVVSLTLSLSLEGNVTVLSDLPSKRCVVSTNGNNN